MPDLRGLVMRHRRPIGAGVVILLIGLGFAALERLTREIRFSDVRAAMHALSAGQIALALALTAASYLALTFYDVLALRVIGRPLPWRTAALASFTSYTLSHNLGLALLTGGSARYRVYTAAGLDAPDVARVIGIAGATFWAGVVTVAAAALALHAGPVTIGGLTLEQGRAHLIGHAALLAAALLVVACGRVRRTPRIFGFALPLPQPGQALAQIAIALVDIGCASTALYMLIPGADPQMLPSFILAYALAIIATVVTHVPGGIGVFEAVVLAVLPGDRATLLAALVAYRAIYYLLPLAAGVTLLAWHEGARQRHAAGRFLADARSIANGIAPLVLSAAIFLGGGMLLLSGALPSLHNRMWQLAGILPLPFIEASHVAASLAGTGLLLLAPGLYRRLDGAFVATRLLLLAGAVFSLAKGIDYEEAFVCLTLVALLQWTRGAFYRRTTLTQRPLSTAWIVSVAMVVGLATWAGFFAYRRVPYFDGLWWDFALHADAPRFLRATLATAVALALAAGWRLMAPVSVERPQPAGAAELVTVRRILDSAERTDAMLALTGDKRFLIADTDDAFLMYQVKGASWIVMGDPVGDPAAWPDLLWRIRDQADRAQGRLMLYEVSGDTLDLAIGMGLQIVKYGEEAVVDLASFVLDTPRLRAVRRSERAVARKGAEFAIVPAAGVPAILDELQTISDGWLRDKDQREKGFSLGRFDRAYVRQFDCAVVRIEGRIVAFANLWLTASRSEASVDLMRHSDEVPPGTMDYLFVQLMLWAKAEGYARFSLGMAPMSGIAGRHLAPAWAKAAALLFRHGERFYGFRGLRAYKDKYAPVWEPRYIAGPHGLGLIQALRDLSRLMAYVPQEPRRRDGGKDRDTAPARPAAVFAVAS